MILDPFDPADFAAPLVPSRAKHTLELMPSILSTCRRLRHIGYTHKINDFRELGTTYESVSHALSTAQRLNEQRKQRAVALLDTVSAYVRVGYHMIPGGDQPGASTSLLR